MTARRTVLAGLALCALAFAASAWLYPALPERIPTHWDWRGEVDGWGDKSWAAFALPGLMALIVALVPALAWLSPRSFSVESFRETYNYLMLLVTGLFGYLHAVSLYEALHPEAESGRVLIGGLFIFFALMGNVLGRVRRNFWVGVRTPWTLASDAVWNATHRLAARLMFGAGVVGALAVWAGAPVAVCFVLFLAAALFPAAYSLVLYRRMEGDGQT